MRPVMRWLAFFLAFGSVTVSAGCTHPAQAASTADRNVITFEEIESAHARTAYDLVMKFRSNFLHSRGRNSILLKTPSEATVYLDEVEYGAVASLRSIPASHVAEIRFIEGWDSMAKYGSDHIGGVIQVVTRVQ